MDNINLTKEELELLEELLKSLEVKENEFKETKELIKKTKEDNYE